MRRFIAIHYVVWVCLALTACSSRGPAIPGSGLLDTPHDYPQNTILRLDGDRLLPPKGGNRLQENDKLAIVINQVRVPRPKLPFGRDIAVLVGFSSTRFEDIKPIAVAYQRDVNSEGVLNFRDFLVHVNPRYDGQTPLFFQVAVLDVSSERGGSMEILLQSVSDNRALVGALLPFPASGLVMLAESVARAIATRNEVLLSFSAMMYPEFGEKQFPAAEHPAEGTLMPLTQGRWMVVGVPKGRELGTIANSELRNDAIIAGGELLRAPYLMFTTISPEQELNIPQSFLSASNRLMETVVASRGQWTSEAKSRAGEVLGEALYCDFEARLLAAADKSQFRNHMTALASVLDSYDAPNGKSFDEQMPRVVVSRLDALFRRFFKNGRLQNASRVANVESGGNILRVKEGAGSREILQFQADFVDQKTDLAKEIARLAKPDEREAARLRIRAILADLKNEQPSIDTTTVADIKQRLFDAFEKDCIPLPLERQDFFASLADGDITMNPDGKLRWNYRESEFKREADRVFNEWAALLASADDAKSLVAANDGLLKGLESALTTVEGQLAAIGKVEDNTPSTTDPKKLDPAENLRGIASELKGSIENTKAAKKKGEGRRKDLEVKLESTIATARKLVKDLPVMLNPDPNTWWQHRKSRARWSSVAECLEIASDGKP